MEIRINDIEEALGHISRTSKVFRTFFKIAFFIGIGFCLLSVIVALGSQLPDANRSAAMANKIITLVPLLIHGLLAVVLLKIGEFFFKDVAKGNSPFTIEQANRVRLAAVIFVVYGVFDLLWSPDLASALFLDHVSIGVWTMNNGPIITHINSGVFIASIVFFALSIVFRYGVLLQIVSDDTL